MPRASPRPQELPLPRPPEGAPCAFNKAAIVSACLDGRGFCRRGRAPELRWNRLPPTCARGLASIELLSGLWGGCYGAAGIAGREVTSSVESCFGDRDVGINVRLSAWEEVGSRLPRPCIPWAIPRTAAGFGSGGRASRGPSQGPRRGLGLPEQPRSEAASMTVCRAVGTRPGQS